MDYKYLNIKDFIFVGYKYEDPSLLRKTKFHKDKKKPGSEKIYYYLPSGVYRYFYSTPKLKSKREKDGYIAEFNHALSSGFLPNSGAQALRKSSYDPKDGKFSIYTPKYFSDYATNERQKGEASKDNLRSVFRRIIPFFENLGIHSICDITNEHLKSWDLSLKYTKKLRGKGCISAATRNSWRKQFRAYLNTAKEQGYALRCNPEKMNIYEFTKGGEIDELADVRHVVYPQVLIDAVQKCTFHVDESVMPDIRKLIRFWREIGVRPAEMYTLNDDNIIYKNGYPIEIRIKKLEKCPNGSKMSFAPKNKKSYRPIKLSDWAGDYILSIQSKLKGYKRYGKYKNKLIEYPFLFVFWDKEKELFLRDDEKLKKLFDDITNHAINEFNLDLRDDYYFYDLRRSANIYFRIEMGYSLSQTCAFLGHSEKTNLKHYTLSEDISAMNSKDAENSLASAIKRDSHIAAKYSRHNISTQSEQEPLMCNSQYIKTWTNEASSLDFSSLNFLDFNKK
ncbi:MAG: site-specific integrase [Halobacteriovoraceae bacterium]|nr:site-specific integrase [Halobacteriovoraceae bacterium]